MSEVIELSPTAHQQLATDKRKRGWTAKMWEKQLASLIQDRKQTTGGKSAMCEQWKRGLKESGEWEKLPAQLRYSIEFYSNLDRIKNFNMEKFTEKLHSIFSASFSPHGYRNKEQLTDEHWLKHTLSQSDLVDEFIDCVKEIFRLEAENDGLRNEMNLVGSAYQIAATDGL